MAEDGRSGLVDLEKELTCSICTDLLYQPLTLLDCLHTFCGACLKEWFQFQASTATSIHPYTCPSCRATVRTTQPNATVTTLLDMFIKANPERGKSEEEKKLDREKYKPGDNVLPKLRRRNGVEEEEDRRMLEEIQQLSLREVGIPSSTTSSAANLEPPRERRRRERSRDTSRESRDSRMREGRSRSRNPPAETSSSRVSREIIPPRHIEHQSSLRSLLSASELDSQEMEEEIMRQIMEEGLLDGIDLNNIDVAQEDEISERIAQAYRRRQSERQRERRERRERLARESRSDSSPSTSSTPQEVRSPLLREEEPSRRRHARSESMANPSQGQNSPRAPPVSRPGLIDAANQGGNRQHHRRSSSQGSARSLRRSDRPAPLTGLSSRQGSSSANDAADRPSTAGTGSTPRRQSENQQRSTLDERQQFRNSLRTHTSSNPNSPRRAAFNVSATESPSSSTAIVASPLSSPPISTSPDGIPPNTRRTTDPTGVRQPRPTNDTPPMISPATFPRLADSPSIEPASTPSATSTPIPTLYPEPSVTCGRCGKEHIEHDLHYHCSICDDGKYDLCLNCYRAGQGCKHWFGFGWAATARYERQAPPGGYPASHDKPHILVGRRYRRPLTPMTESTAAPHTLMTEDDPAYRLESGVFCDICKAFANGCYWKCDTCNEGDWGFCNDCVNQGRHCTHPLLPVTHQISQEKSTTSDPSSAPQDFSLAPPTSGTTTPPLTPRSAALINGPGLVHLANTTFRPLTFTTVCNICTYPIPPSHTRYHCLKCNKGDYDICLSCYHKQIVSNRINREDGPNGWRRCLRAHRMVVVGFEDRGHGQRRIVVKDLVGGWAFRDDPSPTSPSSQQPNSPGPLERQNSLPPPSKSIQHWSWRDADGTAHNPSPQATSPPGPGATGLRAFPPDGGMGLVVQAIWSYYPGENETDELGFPKYSEIREVEDVNGDWFWGVYAGKKGLFPGNFGRVIGSVGVGGV